MATKPLLEITGWRRVLFEPVISIVESAVSAAAIEAAGRFVTSPFRGGETKEESGEAQPPR